MDKNYKDIMGFDKTKAIRDIQIYDALERAHDIRKFEIDLYWRRSNQMYFIVAGLLTAFGVLLSENYFLGATAIACLGTIISFAWVHVNKGSKFWQENWEAHIDILEDSVEGNLYKVVNMEKKENAYSVGRINRAVSWIITYSWGITTLGMIVFGFNYKPKDGVQKWLYDIDIAYVILMLILIFGISCLYYIFRFHESELKYKVDKDVGKYTFIKRDIDKQKKS